MTLLPSNLLFSLSRFLTFLEDITFKQFCPFKGTFLLFFDQVFFFPVLVNLKID